MFHGFDFDSTMLRIGSMNMLLHGVENPDIVYRDSLAQEHGAEEERTRWCWPILRSLARWITRHCAKDLRKCQDEEDRAAVSDAVPAVAQARWARGDHRP